VTDFGPVGEALRRKDETIALMESCTGGLLSSVISSTPGCGDYYLGGIISYATEIKIWAGISEDTIAQHGVVSAETAVEMAQVIRSRFQAGIGIGITGVAGPGSQDGIEPGVVFIGIDGGASPEARKFDFRGNDPDTVKARAVDAAIQWLSTRLSETQTAR
jgi:PncC family amidohydrolase